MDAEHFGGPAGVLAVILLELGLGSLLVLVLAPVWGVVKRGYFLLVAWSVVVCALLARLSANAALSRVESPAGRLLWAFVGLSAVQLALLHRKAPPLVSRLAGVSALVPAVGAVVAIAQIRGDDVALGVVAMLTGAAFLGATWDGMLLGHWYLVDRKLTNDPMRWHAWAFTAGVIVAVVSALLAKGGAPSRTEATYNPLLVTSPHLTTYLALGLIAVNALLAFFVHKLVAEGSIRAATGMLYLAVIMASAAEFAAKARFFTV